VSGVGGAGDECVKSYSCNFKCERNLILCSGGWREYNMVHIRIFGIYNIIYTGAGGRENARIYYVYIIY